MHLPKILIGLFCVLGVALNAEESAQDKLAKAIVDKGDKIEAKAWKPTYEEYQTLVKELKRPVAHGTRTEYFESILENGLGSRKHLPKESTSPESIFVSDLKKADGFLAAYPFALRSMEAKELKVDSQKTTGENVVDRFVKGNELLSNSGIRHMLEKSAKNYLDERGASKGAALVLVYELDKKTNPFTQDNLFVPSEIVVKKPIAKESLKAILVPAAEVENSAKTLEKTKVKAAVYPLELIELQAIETWKAKPKK